jgi:hypothetical protein
MLEKAKAFFYAKALLHRLLEDNNLNAQTLQLTYERLVELYGKELADTAFNNAVVSIIIYLKRKGISDEQLESMSTSTSTSTSSSSSSSRNESDFRGDKETTASKANN